MFLGSENVDVQSFLELHLVGGLLSLRVGQGAFLRGAAAAGFASDVGLDLDGGRDVGVVRYDGLSHGGGVHDLVPVGRHDVYHVELMPKNVPV